VGSQNITVYGVTVWLAWRPLRAVLADSKLIVPRPPRFRHLEPRSERANHCRANGRIQRRRDCAGARPKLAGAALCAADEACHSGSCWRSWCWRVANGECWK
jgi:hypothetical protein